jgi:hypothetical protein
MAVLTAHPFCLFAVDVRRLKTELKMFAEYPLDFLELLLGKNCFRCLLTHLKPPKNADLAPFLPLLRY